MVVEVEADFASFLVDATAINTTPTTNMMKATTNRTIAIILSFLLRPHLVSESSLITNSVLPENSITKEKSADRLGSIYALYDLM